MVSRARSLTESSRASISVVIERWPQQALPQQAAAHAGGGLIEDCDEGCAAIGKDGLDEFEVTDGHGVEHHVGGAIEVTGRVEMVERGALRVAQVMEHGSGGGDGGVFAGEAEAIEREQFEMLAQDAVGIVGGEDPVFELGDDRAVVRAERAGLSAANQGLTGADAFEHALEFGEFDFGGPEFAGRDIDVSDSGARALAGDGGEVVVFVRPEQVRVGGGAGRDDPGHFAADQFLASRPLPSVRRWRRDNRVR